MAQLRANLSTATYNIRKFKGLNENENGDAALKDGEASKMLNFCVTDGGALCGRPTLVKKTQFGNAEVFLGRTDVSGGDTVEASYADNIVLYPSFSFSNGIFDVSGAAICTVTEDSQDIFQYLGSAFFKLGNDVYLLIGNSPLDETITGWKLIETPPVTSMWSGYLDGKERLFAATNGDLFEIHISADGSYIPERKMGLPQSDTVSMFGFDNKLYILTGGLYLAYDGSVISQVEGYIPCVLTACSPDGSGTAYERVNNLSLYRRAQYSADGTSTQYKVLESNVTITKVTIDGVETAAYTQLNGTVTFSTAPSAGTNNIEITYKIADEGTQTIRQSYASNNVGRLVFLFSQVPELDLDIVEVRYYASGELASLQVISPEHYELRNKCRLKLDFTPIAGSAIEVDYKFSTPREAVMKMKYAEIYNGAQDNRVFLYGDGSNKMIYSGITETGRASAEYFPDMNEASVGSSNAPITALVRHYNRLLVFKDGEAYSVYSNLMSLADGSMTTGFYISSVNKSIGCCAEAQAVVVGNRVRTLDGLDIYEWKSTSTAGNITNDQRNAERISQRIYRSLGEFDIAKSKLFYDKERHEFYCYCDGRALVQNVEADAWYVYDGFPVTCMCVHGNKLYCGTTDGYLAVMDKTADADFNCEWVSGSLDFDRPYVLKNSPTVWVSIKPENDKSLSVSAETDNGYSVSEMLNTPPLGHVKPTLCAKLKARKFTRYRLGITTADRITVNGVNTSVVYTNNVK